MTVTPRRMYRRATFFTILLAAASFAAATLSSQTTGGTPDPSFSGDGYVGEPCSIGAPLPLSCNSPATAVAILPDGRFVLAGRSGLWRYTADGERDSPWLSATANFGSGSILTDVAVQSDGRIVAVGRFSNSTGFAIARYLADGTLDTAFDGDGMLVVPMAYGPAGATDIVIQPDGNWLIAGWAEWLPDTVRQFAITRLLPSGQVDTSFGSNGRAYMRFIADATPSGVAVDSAGRVIISGLVEAAGDIPRAAVAARYLPNGAVDGGFGTAGRAIVRSAEILSARALAVQADDHVVVGGIAWEPGNSTSRRFMLIRWTTSGALDPGFGSGGIVSTTFPSGARELNALVIQSDGKLVAGGQAQSMALARYLPDGMLDPAFGVDGLVTGFSSYINDLLIQPDLKIVAAGARVTPPSPFCPGEPCGGGPMPAMARYLP